jgi:AraC-like DNA-binding protein
MDEALKACATLARGLPEPDPADYYSGAHGHLPILPDNVLQFHRHNKVYLSSAIPSLHHRFVLVACLREPGSIVVNDTFFRVEPGQGFLVFPYQRHYYARLEHPNRLSWLFTTFDHAEPGLLEPLRDTVLAFSPRDLQRLHEATTAYLEACGVVRGNDHDTPLALALLLAGLLRRQQTRKTPVLVKKNLGCLDMEFLRPLFTHIDRHLNRPIPIGELACLVHLSPSRLRARFSRALGIGIAEFIRDERIHRACGLLDGAELNVTQISEKCGFNSAYAFSRAFRQVAGMSPTAFRARGKPAPPGRKRIGNWSR